MSRPRRQILPQGLRPRLVSAEEAAAYCGVSVPTFLEHVAPHVGAVCIGRRKLYDLNKIDAWIDRLDPNRQPDRHKSIDELLAEGEDDRAA